MQIRILTPAVLAALIVNHAAAQSQADTDIPPAEPIAGEPMMSDGDPMTDADDRADASPLVDTRIRLDRVIVTARKWEELEQETPQSLTAISHDTLRDSRITTVREASQLAPNVHFTEFSSRRLSFPTIRGIGSGQGDPAVTTYIDGVPQLSVSSTNLPLLDVERIEFLRGPQGTLYGRNSIGGLIHVITRQPTNTPEFRISGGIGNFNHRELQLSFLGPIVEDQLFISLSGQFSSRDGYTTNDFTGNDVDDRESFFGRGQLIWTPTEENEFRLSLYGERARDGGFTLFDLDSIRDRPYHIAHDFEGVTERDVVAPAFTWNHHGESIDFTSISAYVDWDILETADFDFMAFDAVRRRTEEDQQYFSQEFRLSSSRDTAGLELSEDINIHWLIGTQFFISDSNRSAANEFRPAGGGIFFPLEQVGVDTSTGEFDDFGFALFGQATATFLEQFDLTIGLRWDHEEKEADLRRTFATGGFEFVTSEGSFDENFDEFLPRVSLAWRFSEDAMVYGLAARGFKAGGFNLDAPSGEIPFGPETSWTYEAGIKTRWFDERLQVNAAVFHIDWDDLQLSLFDPRVGGYIDNAGAATSQGFELEVVARPIAGLDVFAGIGYTDAEIDAFTDQFGQNTAGNHLAFVPDTTWHAGAQYTGTFGDHPDARWFVRGEYVDIGTYYFDAGNRASDEYSLVNLRVGIEINRFRIEAWMRNALDDDYVLVAFQPNPADPSAFVGENGSPRTFGVSLSVEF
ncbi:MAG: TonB-dependent receptor [Phycisphaerales bacterium]